MKQSNVFFRELPCARNEGRAHAAKYRCKKVFPTRRRLSRGYHIARTRACSQADRMWKKPNKKVMHQEKGEEEEQEGRRTTKKKTTKKEKPMIFLRWRKVKAVAAEQTSVGRNLRSISEQGPSNLTEQTKRWPL